MKIFQLVKEAKKQFNHFFDESRKMLSDFKKPSLKEGFSNAVTLFKTGSKQVVDTPEIIAMAVIRLVLILSTVALIAYSFYPVFKLLDTLHLDKKVTGAITFIWFLPLFYILPFITGSSNGAIGAASFLHQTNQNSTLLKCYNIALQNAGNLTTFMFINYILLRQTSSRNRSTITSIGKKFMKLAWQVGSLGVLPAMLNGRNFKEAFGRSFELFKKYPTEVVSIRFGYSFITKIILASIPPVIFLPIYLENIGLDVIESLPLESFSSGELFLWAGGGYITLLLLVRLIINPIYISTVYHLYGKFLQENNYPLTIELKKPTSKFATFVLASIVFYALVPILFEGFF